MKASSVRNIVGQVRTENISGMKPEDVKRAVLKELCVGCFYTLKSVSMGEKMKMKLIGIYSNMAEFEAKNGQRECFKYIELYKQFYGSEEDNEA